MKMDIGSSQSWWWESHNRPKHSKWLQENLADVETNVQAMLRLIEGDADSFAQRAEMYYKKRPDLLKVVEQFYRGYRALAERYDQLSGSIRQIPAAIQAQYGLLPESPRTSPFGKQMTFKKQGSSLDKVANSYAESNNTESPELSGCEGDGEHFDVSSVDEKSVGRSQDGNESSSSSSCSDGESDVSNPEVRILQQKVERLQDSVERLQGENKKLNEKSKEKLQQYRDTEKRLHGFREDFLRAQKENNTLKAGIATSEKLTKQLEEEVRNLRSEKESLQGEVAAALGLVQELEMKLTSLQKESENSSMKVMELQIQNTCSQEQNEKLVNQIYEQEEKQKELVAAVRFMKGIASILLRKNKALVDQVSGLLEDRKAKERAVTEKTSEILKMVDEIQKLKSSVEANQGAVSELKGKVSNLVYEVSTLQEENEKQRLAISECAEEKREAIRQLCFSMDLLNNRNQWLEELLLSAKSKLSDYQKLALAAQSSGWRGIFSA